MALSINGEIVDDALIRQEAAMLRPRHEELIEGMDPVEREIQIREWSRENVIERILLRQEALKDPTPIPAEEIEAALPEPAEEGSAAATEDQRRDAETRLRLDRLLSSITAGVKRPKPKDVGDYYKKNKSQFVVEESINAAHIVKNVDESMDDATALAAIQEAERELKAGANFHELADRLSDCAGNGGHLGFFARGQMVDEFEQVVFSMQPGQTSPIFRSVFGYHIARVLDRRPAGYRGLQEVKDVIEETLFRQKQEAAIEAFVDKLRAKADVRDVKQVSL